MSLQETYPAFKRSNNRTEIFEQMHESQNWASIEHDGWHLPAIDEPKEDCGKWMTKGCLDHAKHHGEFKGKVFIKTFQKSCYRASCQICYKKWMARESNKATRRIETYEKLSKKPVKHIMNAIIKLNLFLLSLIFFSVFLSEANLVFPLNRNANIAK